MGAVNNSMFYRERVAFLRAIGVEVIARAFEVPVLVASLLLVSACTSGSPEMDVERLQEFGTEYTAAWSSHDPAQVAAFFAEGSGAIHKWSPEKGKICS